MVNSVLQDGGDPLDDELDLGRIVARLWDCRKWLLLSVAAFGGAFALVAFLLPPTYRASVLLLPAESNSGGLGGSLGSALGQLGGLASLVGVNVGSSNSNTEEALAVVRSRQFVESFIVENRLMQEFYADRWDAQRGEWREPPAEQPRVARAVKRFTRSISSIDQDKKTGLVTLRIDWRDPVKAAQWANLLVEKLNSEMRMRAIAKADASMGFLRRELAETSEIGTREAINRLLESQINQRMLANVTHEYAFRVVDRATPPERDEVLQPNKLLLLVTGPLLGLVIAILAALLFSRNPALGAQR